LLDGMSRTTRSSGTVDEAERGLDIFQLANKSISGWLPFEKTGTGPGSRMALPYTAETERDALLYLANHPRVAYVQRGDMKPSFAAAHRLGCRLEVPFVIPYEFEGRTHDYYIDWVGVTDTAALFGVEASIEEFKSDAQSRTKMAAADAFFRKQGGWYGLFLPGETISDVRVSNLLRLNAHRADFAGYDELAGLIQPLLLGPGPISIREITARLGPEHGDRLVEAASWRRIALAVAAGRLLVDLDRVLIDLDTPLSLLPPNQPAILPPRLPSGLPERPTTVDAPGASPLLPGRTVDPASVPEHHREAFKRNLAAVLAVLRDEDAEAVARRSGLSRRQLRRLVADARAGGEEALVPHRREVQQVTEIDPIFLGPIRKLLGRRQRLTYRQITEAPELVAVAKKAYRETGTTVPMPTYAQVVRYAHRVEDGDAEIRMVRSGVRHLPHSATSVSGYVASIASPALVLQVDEHWLDLFVVTDEGAKLTERVHAAVLIDAKTAAILGAVLSPRALTEEDYLRLLKQAMEPKDEVVRRHGCINPWPCFGRPAQILSDRGKIFISKHATDVVVDRFGINEAVAPPYAPSVKGVVEALFRWITERFSHRLEGTTKSSPADRGTYDSQQAALDGGIAFVQLESLFYRAIVDGYMQDVDGLRGGVRIGLWERDVARFGVPQWLGSADELKLLLMRSHNTKHPDGLYFVQGGGVSFKGNWYVGEEGLTRRIREDRGPVTQVSGPKVTSTAPDALVGAALTTSQCWQVTIARYGTNILGAKLYQLNLWSKWCSNSNKMSLTEWYYRVYPSDMAILWFYVTGGGYPDVHAYGGPPTFSGEFWAMGRFQYCLAGVQGIGCIQEKYPWLDIGFRANGVWWWSSGG
jgi:hypothetical protein